MKKFLLSLLLLSPAALLGAQTEKQWMMVPDGNMAQPIPVSGISFLITADDEANFTAVCHDGTVRTDIATASFCQMDPTAITTPLTDGNATKILCAANRLTLTGCPTGALISIYTTGGQQVLKAEASQATTTISIAQLPTGTYLIKVADTTLKFIKK